MLYLLHICILAIDELLIIVINSLLLFALLALLLFLQLWSWVRYSCCPQLPEFWLHIQNYSITLHYISLSLKLFEIRYLNYNLLSLFSHGEDLIHILILHELARSKPCIPDFSLAYTYSILDYYKLWLYQQCLRQVFLL